MFFLVAVIHPFRGGRKISFPEARRSYSMEPIHVEVRMW